MEFHGNLRRKRLMHTQALQRVVYLGPCVVLLLFPNATEVRIDMVLRQCMVKSEGCPVLLIFAFIFPTVKIT